MPSILVLGATSAIARAVAEEYARQEYDLILAARDEEDLGFVAADLRIRTGVAVHDLPFDALQMDAHSAFWSRCRDLAGGRVDGLVLCFAYATEQAIAQSDFTEARDTIDATFTGAVSILNQIANSMEEEKSGFICVVSSVAGDRGRQSNYIYGSAKAGLTAFLQGMRNRLFRAGVPVTTIKLGFADTKMSYGLPGLFLVASPKSAARAIVRAVRKKKDVVYVPWFWRYIMWIIRTLPEPIFKRLRL